MKQDFIVRHCQECGQKFVTGNRAQRFCCEKCNAAFYYQVRKKMPAYLSQVEEDPAAKTHFTITGKALCAWPPKPSAVDPRGPKFADPLSAI